MSSAGRSARLVAALALALAMATLGLSGALARAQSPASPAGSVPSILALSLGEPGPFKRVGSLPRGGLFATTIRAEATATVIPTRLSVADGDTGSGHRRGYLGRGASLLASPLAGIGRRRPAALPGRHGPRPAAGLEHAGKRRPGTDPRLPARPKRPCGAGAPQAALGDPDRGGPMRLKPQAMRKRRAPMRLPRTTWRRSASPACSPPPWFPPRHRPPAGSRSPRASSKPPPAPAGWERSRSQTPLPSRCA